MRNFPERSTKNSVHPSRLGKMAFLMMLTSQSRMSSALRAASIRAFSSSLYSPPSLESTSSFKFPAKKTSSPLSCNRQLTFSSQSRISVCAASTTTRAASSSAEVDDEQLDAVLDSILEEVIYEAGGPASKNPPSPAKSKALPKALIENDDVDYKDPEFLSTSNPHWVERGFDQRVIDVLSGKGITHLTPVQAEAFAPILAGRDVIGRSRTGTGKTLAFGIPSLLRLYDSLQQSGKYRKKGRMTSMVILCPTRELARQVQEEVQQVGTPLGLYSAVFHGGVSYDPQARDLRNGLDVLVGTPGRVIDHIQRGNLDLSECEIAVLDEADEMLNMGFAEDVETILENAGKANNEKTQCLLFSATTPPWVKDIGRQYQKDVLSIDSTSSLSGARTATTVKHFALQVPPGMDARKSILEDIIAVNICRDTEETSASSGNLIAEAAKARKAKDTHMQQKIFGKTIVFTETKRDADELVSSGVFKSLTAQALHGDVGQKQRDATLNAFRKGSFNVLVATDVAARGIDIQDVDLVIQFGPPRDPDTYVHRSGRTGRAGNKGVSICLFGPSQAKDVINIERSLGHGFKFELVGPPSAEAALTAISKTSAAASKSIPNETSAFFEGAARGLLEEDGADPVDIVAKCLAAISRRSTDIQSRSLLTGEEGVSTIEMTNVNGRSVSPGDVMFTVSKLARMSRNNEDSDLIFESEIGKIQSSANNISAFFDMSVEDAKKLVEFSKNIDAGGARFAIAKEMEIERDSSFGQQRTFTGRGGGRGGGSTFRDSGRGRDSRYGAPSFYDDSRKSGGGRGRGAGRSGVFRRGNDTYNSGGDRSGRTNRYEGGARRNDGW